MYELFDALLHLDPSAIAQAGGVLGVSIVIFAESGLLIGMFFPGDSLLFAAGLFAGQGMLDPTTLAVSATLAAILGDSFGYWFGARLGPRLFSRPDSRFFKREYLIRTETFFARWGTRAIVLARFTPIVRTLTPILAGASSMPYHTFALANVLGGILWSAGIVTIGTTLGATIPGLEHYLLPIVILISIISLIPVARHALTAHYRSRETSTDSLNPPV